MKDYTSVGLQSKVRKRSSVMPLDTKENLNDKVLLHLRSIRDEAYRSKNVAEQVFDDSCSSRLILHPDSIPRITWDMVVMIFILYQSLEVPFRLCFEVPLTGSWIILDFVITIVFVFDIIICFNTGFYSHGNIILTRCKISKRYLLGWFWIDAISTMPFNWFISGVFVDEQINSTSSNDFYQGTKLIRAVRIFRFLRILKLLRLTKLQRILIKVEDYIASTTLATVFVFIRLLSLVFFVAHWTACWWYFIGNQDMATHPVTWIVFAKVADKSTFDKYVAALYWAFTTMTTVGYGDIYPFTVNEKVFAMFTMILACGIFAYTVGSIGSLVSKQNSGENAYREQVVAVNRYMRKKKLPYDLQFRVRRYLEYVWENRKKNNIDEKQIINLLSEPLRDEIYAHIHGVVINNCSIFTIFEKHFISQLTKTLESETYAPGDIVIEEGEMSTKMYFIQNGKIDIYHHSTRSTICELDKNKYFGEIAFFLQTPRCASAKCIDFVDLLSLSRLNLNILLDKFPEAKIENEKLIERCAENDLTALNVVCYVCQKTGHVAIKCKMILLNQDHDNAKEKWLENRKEAYSHEIDTTRLDPSNYNRVPKNLLKSKTVPRNVIGIPKEPGLSLNETSKIGPTVKDYLDEAAGDKHKDETKLDISLGDDLGQEVEKDEKDLVQKYSLIYRNSDSEPEDSIDDSQDDESEDEKIVKGSGRQFRNSLLLTPLSPPVRVANSSFTSLANSKGSPMMPQYNINENIIAATPYNTIEDDGYEAECE